MDECQPLPAAPPAPATAATPLASIRTKGRNTTFPCSSTYGGCTALYPCPLQLEVQVRIVVKARGWGVLSVQ